jgi:hypothetical protein
VKRSENALRACGIAALFVLPFDDYLVDGRGDGDTLD